MAAPPGTKSIVFFALPPVRELDLIGAIDVFSTANQIAGGKPLYDLKIVSAEIVKGARIAGMFGIDLSCDGDYRSFKTRIDTLLVPGGSGTQEKTADRAALQWLRKVAKSSRRVGSICTGAALLAQAGLLDGRRATTHWGFAGDLARRFPKVRVDSDPIWVQDGNYYTSAGVTSGIDLCLALVEEDHGAALALEVARVLVVFLKRPGNQAQFSVSLAAQKTERKPLHELSRAHHAEPRRNCGSMRICQRRRDGPRLRAPPAFHARRISQPLQLFRKPEIGLARIVGTMS
jgi:transcriptional regulator GlxA family with amidase domain